MANPKDSKYYVDNVTPGEISPGKSSFFDVYFTPDPARWNQSFPYQLKLLLVNDSKSQQNVQVSNAVEDGKMYTNTGWNFTLPIPPQELNIVMPFASIVEATIDGIVEQHGGAPFRDITLNGTTGITPIKGNADPLLSPAETLGLRTAKAIFAGTANAIQNIVEDAKVVTSGHRLFTMNNVNDGLGEEGQPNTIPTKSTGYYQFRLLQKFLETYAELKKKNGVVSIDGKSFNTKNLRLAFCAYKDQSIYICTPVSFVMRRSSANPMEYMYNLQLRAWRRIRDIDVAAQTAAIEIGKRSPNLFAQLMTRANAAVDLINNVTSLHKAIIQDPTDRLKEIGRTTSLFFKAVNGANASLSDMPKHFQKDLLGLVAQNWKDLRDKLKDLSIGPASPSIMSDGVGKLTKTKPNAPSFQSPSNKDFSALSNDQIDSILKTLKISDLKLPSTLAKQIQTEIFNAKNQTRLDFENQRIEIDKLMADFTDSIGAGDITFSETYNRPAPTSTKLPTDDEFNLLFALNELSTIMGHLAATFDTGPQTLSSLDYVAGLAAGSGIAFKVPTSKFAVPMPYGVSLERLALQYLGDANRWIEIATLNGLRAPYIDEEGFDLPFLTNGNKNTLFVNSKENLYINQTVWLSSSAVFRSKRHIVNIEEVSPDFIAVTVDGDAIDGFTVANGSKLSAFLPNTVNSQQVIYIPSDLPAPTDLKSKDIPGVDIFDPFLNVAGIDLLLDSSGDLIIGSDGDARLAYGLQNLIQTIKLALTTPQGALLQHPTYGISIPIGASTADVNAQDVVKTAVATFENDPAFKRVVSAVAKKNGPALEIILIIEANGISSLIPVTFTITP